MKEERNEIKVMVKKEQDEKKRDNKKRPTEQTNGHQPSSLNRKAIHTTLTNRHSKFPSMNSRASSRPAQQLEFPQMPFGRP